MVNAWSLLYDELYGDDEMSDKTYSVENTQPNDDINITTATTNDTYTVSDGDGDGTTVDFSDLKIGLTTASADTTAYFVDPSDYEVTIDTSNYPDLSGAEFVDFTLGDNPVQSTPGIQQNCARKYKEDESIEALKNYISTTYGGHYTSDNNSVQTLDLIESVGDAESFCRSNAIKYLSRYDKKGQAKRDILKALHYSLLLYHFSGQLNETTTRGYETF